MRRVGRCALGAISGYLLVTIPALLLIGSGPLVAVAAVVGTVAGGYLGSR